MAIAAPAPVFAEYGQDLTVTVTLSTPTDVSLWTVSATLRAYPGGPVIGTTKTIGSGITVTNATTGVFVVSFSAADLTQTPGPYVWEMDRTNPGFLFPIVDPSLFYIRPSSGGAAPALVNQAEWLAVTQRTANDTETKQDILTLAAAESFIKRVCGREFSYGTRTLYLDGTGTPDLLIPETPVQSITSLNLDPAAYWGTVAGSFDATTLLTSGTDYALVPDKPDGFAWAGIVRRIGSVWPYSKYRPPGYLGYRQVACPGCVKVTFVSGFAGGLIPMDLKLGIFELASLYRNAALDGRTVMSEAGEGVSFSFAGFDQEAMRLGNVRNVIALYKRGSLYVR